MKKENIDKVFESCYPNHWKRYANDYFIHYPEITVTNVVNEKHTMKDVWIKISLEPKGFSNYSLISFSIARESLSLAEYVSEYQFSHTDKSNYFHWGSLCTGSGYFNDLYSKIRGDDQFNEATLEEFLLALQFYLEWESIEGTPYHYIDNIKLSNRGSSIPSITHDDVENTFHSLLEKLNNEYLELDYEDKGNYNVIKVKDTSKLQSLILEVAPLKHKYQSDDGINPKSELTSSEIIRLIDEAENQTLEIAGEIVNRKIHDKERVIAEDNDSLIVNPYLVEKIINKLSLEITKFQLNYECSKTNCK
jgi:hypothetical protein